MDDGGSELKVINCDQSWLNILNGLLAYFHSPWKMEKKFVTSAVNPFPSKGGIAEFLKVTTPGYNTSDRTVTRVPIEIREDFSDFMDLALSQRQ